jgi:hypothetical protein
VFVVLEEYAVTLTHATVVSILNSGLTESHKYWQWPVRCVTVRASGLAQVAVCDSCNQPHIPFTVFHLSIATVDKLTQVVFSTYLLSKAQIWAGSPFPRSRVTNFRYFLRDQNIQLFDITSVKYLRGQHDNTKVLKLPGDRWVSESRVLPIWALLL